MIYLRFTQVHAAARSRARLGQGRKELTRCARKTELQYRRGLTKVNILYAAA
jgi:hypothetical protein